MTAQKRYEQWLNDDIRKEIKIMKQRQLISKKGSTFPKLVQDGIEPEYFTITDQQVSCETKAKKYSRGFRSNHLKK